MLVNVYEIYSINEYLIKNLNILFSERDGYVHENITVEKVKISAFI
jgi:hypothetical protein